MKIIKSENYTKLADFNVYQGLYAPYGDENPITEENITPEVEEKMTRAFSVITQNQGIGLDKVFYQVFGDEGGFAQAFYLQNRFLQGFADTTE